MNTRFQSDPERWRLVTRVLALIFCGALLLIGLVITLQRGSVDIPTDQVIKGLQSRSEVEEFKEMPNGTTVSKVPVWWTIVHEQRLARALVGALVGMNLAVAGTMLQGALRSPLADPYILGVSAGGGLAAAYVLLEVEGGSGNASHTAAIAAFIGSLIGALIVYAVAWDGTGITTTRLVLAGVALTAMFGAFTTTIVVMNVEVGGQIVFLWLVGGLYTADWTEYYLIAPYTLIGLFAALLLARRANVLALGDEVAQGLGLNVAWTRFLMSACAALLAGSSVSVAGLVGFVGLLVPFIARRLVGSDFRYLIPTSGILGAALMVWADTAARVYFPRWLIDQQTNQQFPVGIITAVIGGPLFMWLVRARRSQW